MQLTLMEDNIGQNSQAHVAEKSLIQKFPE